MSEGINPVRLCCGQRHNTVQCPDGLVMCCICFHRVSIDMLNKTANGHEDICLECAENEAIIMAGNNRAWHRNENGHFVSDLFPDYEIRFVPFNGNYNVMHEGKLASIEPTRSKAQSFVTRDAPNLAAWRESHGIPTQNQGE